MTTQTPPTSPDVEPATLIARAAALRPRLIEQQEEAEQRGHYGPEIHEALREAGLYDLLTPRRYGGLEADLKTFAQVVIELGRGDPSAGWCYCLGAGHALTTAAWWPQAAQDEVFRTDAGYFRASHSLQPSGTATRVDGGYRIDARSPYQSGIPYSTHATVCVMLAGTGGDGPPTVLQALVPVADLTVLEDWGGDATIGMRASGSNTVLVDGAVVPESYVIELDWQSPEKTTSFGVELHGNPMYLGVAQAFLNTELVACVVGTAWAAYDEYERLMRTKTSALPPRAPRTQDALHQHDLGVAKMRIDAAEAIVLQAAERYGEWCAAAVAGEQPFTRLMDVQLFGMLTQAGQLASEAVETLYRSAGSSAAMRGQRMQRYVRDVAMYRTHTSAQYDALAQRIGAVLVGEATSVF